MKICPSNKILIISPEPTHPQNAGNRARIFSLLNNLKGMGHEIHFIYFCLDYPAGHIFGKPDKKEMASYWHKFYYVPYLHQMPSFRLKTLSNAIFLMSENKIPAFFIGIITSTIMSYNILFMPKEIIIGKISQFLLRNVPFLYKVLKPMYHLLKSALRREKHPGLKKVQTIRSSQKEYLERKNKNGAVRKVESEISYDIDDWYNDGLDSLVSRLHNKYGYNTVISEYVFLSKSLLNFDKTVFKIIDTHDIFTDRNKKYNDRKLQDTFFSTNKYEEAKGLNRADLVFAIQDNEREQFAQMCDKQVVTIGHKVKLVEPVERIEKRNNLLYIGAGNIANIHGVDKFIRKILPRIQIELPNAKLILAGAICAFIHGKKDCVKLGEIDDLGIAYNMADVVINPNEIGTGLKIKNIEALGYSKPLVTTRYCAEGFHDCGSEFIIAESDDQFADVVLEILKNKDIYTRLTEKAYHYAKNYNDKVDMRLQRFMKDQFANL